MPLQKFEEPADWIGGASILEHHFTVQESAAPQVQQRRNGKASTDKQHFMLLTFTIPDPIALGSER
jgi:hypothetical protein